MPSIANVELRLDSWPSQLDGWVALVRAVEPRLAGIGALLVDVEGGACESTALDGDPRPLVDASARMLASVRSRIPVVVIAAGDLAGPLLSLALRADLLVVRAGMVGRPLEWQDRPFLFPGDLPALAVRVGRARALELAFVGDELTGEELVRRGAAVDASSGAASVSELLAGSRVAQTAVSGLLRRRETGRSAAEALERAQFALCFASPDRDEGVAAFLGKRPPRFPSHHIPNDGIER